MADMKWNGPQLSALVRRAMEQRLDAAAIAVQNHAKTLISVDGTGVRQSTTTVRSGPNKGKKRRKGTLIEGANPSKPGDPPHVQTGQLMDSVAHERQGLVARVGTGLKKGLYLELGTENMAPRPWLRRSLIEMTPAVNAIIGKPIE